MEISFSAIRKRVEQEHICSSLTGCIQYFVTRYRKVHDQEGRIGILFGQDFSKTSVVSVLILFKGKCG